MASPRTKELRLATIENIVSPKGESPYVWKNMGTSQPKTAPIDDNLSEAIGWGILNKDLR